MPPCIRDPVEAGALNCVRFLKTSLPLHPAKRHRRSAAAYLKPAPKLEAAISAIVGRVGVGC